MNSTYRLSKNVTSFASVYRELSPVNFLLLQEFPFFRFSIYRVIRARAFFHHRSKPADLSFLFLSSPMAFSPLSLFLSRSPSQLSRSRSSLSLGVVAPAFRRSRSLALKSLGPRVRTLDIAKVFQRSYNLSTCTLYAKHCAISSTVQRDTLRRVYIGKIRTGSWKFV